MWTDLGKHRSRSCCGHVIRQTIEAQLHMYMEYTQWSHLPQESDSWFPLAWLSWKLHLKQHYSMQPSTTSSCTEALMHFTQSTFLSSKCCHNCSTQGWFPTARSWLWSHNLHCHYWARCNLLIWSQERYEQQTQLPECHCENESHVSKLLCKAIHVRTRLDSDWRIWIRDPYEKSIGKCRSASPM